MSDYISMVKTKELKPPEELAQAIQSSDTATAPSSADASGEAFTGNTPRTVRAHLLHEEEQRLTETQRGTHGALGHVPTPEEKKIMREEQEHLQNKPPEYNRDHPGAGKAGRGDNVVNSMLNMGAGRQAPLDHHKFKNAPQGS